MISIKKGLDIPISGAPEQQVSAAPEVTRVAVVGTDYVGMKPTMAVAEGDQVELGSQLFEDKKNPGVIFTAPAAGKVVEINRGERRMLESVVIEIDENGGEKEFSSFEASQISDLDRQQVVDQLIKSGQWVALRTRPYSRIPAPDAEPESIFVNAMDTNPLAMDPKVAIDEEFEAFSAGVAVLSRLTKGKVFVCHAPGSEPKVSQNDQVELHSFAGPHPAGLTGTHIHHLNPVTQFKSVWTIGYQEVIAYGKLFTTGKIWTQRLVALAGPQVEEPTLLRTRLGADLQELTKGRLKEGENRLISGSILNGKTASDALGFLGRYDNQVSVLLEGRDRPLLHYCQAGRSRFSAIPIYISRLMGKKDWDFTTTTNGSDRAMVPIGVYERVFPLDILPTQLLRSLIVGDTEGAVELGALELDEEDLSLCTFVCPGKYEFGPILRDTLTRVQEEF